MKYQNNAIALAKIGLSLWIIVFIIHVFFFFMLISQSSIFNTAWQEYGNKALFSTLPIIFGAANIFMYFKLRQIVNDGAPLDMKKCNIVILVCIIEVF